MARGVRLPRRRGVVARGLVTAIPLEATRAVLRVAGTDAAKFLQSVATNDVAAAAWAARPTDHDAAKATAFLTHKGRIVTADCLMFLAAAPPADAAEGPWTFLLDVAKPAAGPLGKFLKMFKLRAKADLTDVSADVRVWALLGPPDEVQRGVASLRGQDGIVAAPDPRFPSADQQRTLGARAVVPVGVDVVAALATAGLEAIERPVAVYHETRLCHGLAEGSEVANMIPLECNIDMLHGVSFSKGCYIGQELTARTHFKGQVRKRLMPLVLLPQPPPSTPTDTLGWQATPALAFEEGVLRVHSPPGAMPDVPAGTSVVDVETGKAVGKVVSRQAGVAAAVAQLRLDRVVPTHANLVLVPEGGDLESTPDTERTYVQPFLPPWWPAGGIDPATGQLSVSD